MTPVAPVTCSLDGRFIRVTVVGDYHFDDVKREVARALEGAGAGPKALLYDMRGAARPASGDEVRARARWLGSLRDVGLRACAVIVPHATIIMGVAGMPILKDMGITVERFETVTAAELWSNAELDRAP